jgi:hypothetical protein
MKAWRVIWGMVQFIELCKPSILKQPILVIANAVDLLCVNWRFVAEWDLLLRWGLLRSHGERQSTEVE